MSSQTTNETLCRSVFKSGENTTNKVQFTKAWINLINRLEKSEYLTN